MLGLTLGLLRHFRHTEIGESSGRVIHHNTLNIIIITNNNKKYEEVFYLLCCLLWCVVLCKGTGTFRHAYSMMYPLEEDTPPSTGKKKGTKVKK